MQRAMASRKGTNTFLPMWTSMAVHPWTKIEPTDSRSPWQIYSRRSLRRILSFTSLTRAEVCTLRSSTLLKKATFLCWCHFHRFRFYFELSPRKSCFNCSRLGIWKHPLRMSKGNHVVMDFPDIRGVNFVSQHGHFEVSQLAV